MIEFVGSKIEVVAIVTMMIIRIIMQMVRIFVPLGTCLITPPYGVMRPPIGGAATRKGGTLYAFFFTYCTVTYIFLFSLTPLLFPFML